MIFRSYPSKSLAQRLDRLKTSLAEEHPLLLDVVKTYLELDRVGYTLGLLGTDESYATRISWWPFVAVLGTFSAGKSSFINQYTGINLQETGNQAVDDRFTVICYSRSGETRTLPGYSLDADPRFPFYQVSQEINKVASGEGNRIDTYLQLKTCPSEALKGRIIIDSPGFDADDTRNTILRLTDHIVDLSDLVLVFFDARHPEPGSMRDTLQHLVGNALKRDDTNKFLFILNQIDTTAREDNFEQVVAAWQRALASSGMVSGRFYCIYNEAAAVDMRDETVRDRLKSKRDRDLGEIMNRISEVSVERVYRTIGALDSISTGIEQEYLPKMRAALALWRSRVLMTDVVSLGVIIAILLGLMFGAGLWNMQAGDGIQLIVFYAVLAAAVAGFIALHFIARKFWAKRVGASLAIKPTVGNVARAWARSTVWYRTLLLSQPAGWRRAFTKRLARIRETANVYVQKTNDRYANPSGKTK